MYHTEADIPARVRFACNFQIFTRDHCDLLFIWNEKWCHCSQKQSHAYLCQHHKHIPESEQKSAVTGPDRRCPIRNVRINLLRLSYFENNKIIENNWNKYIENNWK